MNCSPVCGMFDNILPHQLAPTHKTTISRSCIKTNGKGFPGYYWQLQYDQAKVRGEDYVKIRVKQRNIYIIYCQKMNKLLEMVQHNAARFISNIYIRKGNFQKVCQSKAEIN